MKRRDLFVLAVVATFQVIVATAVLGDTFGSGENQFDIEFVTVGHPGNPSTRIRGVDIGSVGYAYRIGKYEISEEVIRKAVRYSENSLLPLNLSIDARGENKPATGLTWLEAARFVNWLNTSKGFSSAYKFRESTQPPLPIDGFELWQPTDPGYDENNPYRNTLARYVLPDLDEWHKAAFYDPVTEEYYEFATGSNAVPLAIASGTMDNTAVYLRQSGPADVTLAGGSSPYGTVAQGGNVWEWQEDSTDGFFSGTNVEPAQRRLLRGGDWGSQASQVSEIGLLDQAIRVVSPDVGFRVVSVPEPKGIETLVFVLLCFVQRSRTTEVAGR